jgi:hypothetical protein
MRVDPGATIDALSSAISALLAPPADPGLPPPQVAILPARTSLAGIGGFIGTSIAPPADRIARHLDGEVVVRVFADNAADLLAAEARVARNLLAASPDLLRRQGILRLQRVPESPGRRLEAADGIGAPFGQELRFAVKFEHAPLPGQSEGQIDSVPQDIALAGSRRSGRLLYQTEFLSDPLADFTPVTGGQSGSLPAWTYDAVNQELRQTSTRIGGEDGPSGNKTGAYLVLNDSAAGGALTDFILHAEMRSDGLGGIGLVFRFRPTQNSGPNFGFFLMEEPTGLRLFGRRRNATGALLAEGGQDLTRGFEANAWLRLRLIAEGDRFELAINEVVALTGNDAGLREPGSVGLFCRGNPNARFRHFKLMSL